MSVMFRFDDYHNLIKLRFHQWQMEACEEDDPASMFSSWAFIFSYVGCQPIVSL